MTWRLTSHEFLISQDVIFHEYVFPFEKVANLVEKYVHEAKNQSTHLLAHSSLDIGPFHAFHITNLRVLDDRGSAEEEEPIMLAYDLQDTHVV